MTAFTRAGKLRKLIGIFVVLAFCASPFGLAQVSQDVVDQLVKENKELRSLVGDLSKKVTGLEERLSRTERGAAPVSVAAPTEGFGVLETKGGNIQLDGHVDTSINWNFVTPNTGPQTGPAQAGNFATGNSVLRAFDRESDTFDLNSIQLNIYRPAPTDGGVGFRTEFNYGTDAQVIESAGFLGGTDEFSIQEAYVELKAPIGSGLTVIAGKFATLHGAEVIENFVNWNASRSFLFTLAIPFTHTGVRAMYNFLDGKVQTGVGFVNGWDNAIDNNRPKDVEAMVQWQVTDHLTVRENFMVGSQVADDRGDNRFLFDTVVTWVPLPEQLPKLTLMGNYDYATEERLAKGREGGPADWQGYALYAKYDLYDWLTLAARWEQFWDDNALRTGFTGINDLWEMTYTADIKVYKNLLARIEYRHDHAESGLDVGGVPGPFDNSTENNQSTIGASLIYLFG